VSKLSIPRKFVLASWIAAVAVLAAIGVAVGAGPRIHRGNAIAKRTAGPAPLLNAETSVRVRANLEASPLAFEANQGQTDPQVKYMARGSGYTVFLTANDAVFALHSSSQAAAEKNRTAAIHMHLVGGNPQSQITAGSQLPGRSNYFIGNDPSQWHANVAQFARVSYRDAYPGVNLAFYGKQKQLEFDFIVAPGASPAPIRLGVSGANRMTTDDSGNLILASSAGDVLLHKPVAYQQKDGARQPVDARFVLQAHNQVSFELGNYDRSRELVIDPSVSYATYLGGLAEDDGHAIAVDGSGDAYVTGQTMSNNFPGTSSANYKGGFDVFVTKISADGSSLLYSTYVGGPGNDSGNAIALDASGDAFVAGGAATGFPTTSGAYQTTFQGGNVDAFVFELAPSGGSLVYSTYLGGNGDDVATGIALAKDASGDTFVVGSTTSTNFPTMPTGGLSGMSAGGFVTKMNSSGNGLVYSSYLGASSKDFANAVAVDASNNAYITGGTISPTFPVTAGVFQPTCGTVANCNGGLYDAFVSVINAAGNGFVYSTFLGGESNDQGLAIAVDSAGDAYVTGSTSSAAFPTHSPFQATWGKGLDAFVSELNPTGTALIYSTYLGGNADDIGLAIAVDSGKNAYITGVTGSPNFPIANPTQGKNNGQNDAFVTEISAGGATLSFSTYLGGALNENTATTGGGSLAGIAVDSAGANIYVTGNTTSTDFPTIAAEQPKTGGGADAFVARYSPSPFSLTAGALSPSSGPPGVSATSTVTVTPLNGFTGTVTLGCTVKQVVPDVPTCTGTSVNITSTAPATGTLTVNTTAASALLERPSSGIFYAMLMPVGGMALLGAGIGSAGSRRRTWFGFLLLGLLLSGLFLMPACGGSGGGTKTGNGGTPTGPYAITVTGTSGSTVVGGTPTLTLTVN
jgi:hypothetical protein